ncbi:MAG: nucleoside triphosphate pyrophosphohydrolase [Desulfobacteraceae bacterium]
MVKPSIESAPPSVQTLLDLIAALRGENGCPWDRKQTPGTLTVYLIEEMYELVEAIHADDTAGVLEELGDLLFQVLFITYMYAQDERFSLEQVLERIIKKMIHRHPHVFGDRNLDNSDQVKQQWRKIKQQEKGREDSLLDSVPSGMPALMRAYRISERAAGTGFDWDTIEGVMAQAEAEWCEFRDEVDQPEHAKNQERVTMELGDVLFTLVNVARLAGVHPESALAKSTTKFIHRFNHMEIAAADQNCALEKMPKEALEQLWQAAKKSAAQKD